MEPVTIALALAKATGADEWFLDKINGNKTAKKVLEIATSVTGINSADKNLDAITKDPALAAKIKLALVANKQEIAMAAFEDRRDARSMYRIHPAQADKLAERIMKWNLPYIAFLLVVNIAAIYFLKDHSALLAVVANVLGMAIKSLFDERKEVSGFYFGGSMQSSPDNGKNKDE
jgi:hypothetical protein